MTQWREKGLIVDPPDYQDGVYNTSYCGVTQIEKDLFDLKAVRSNPSMRQVANYVMQMKGKSGNIVRLSPFFNNKYRVMIIS